MAQPITWRNVDAPDLRGAGALMGLAGNSLNTGFDKLGEVLKQRQDIASQNWDQQKVNNTQAFMDTLSKYRTPEEYQAALASGELDQQRQGYGAQIDPVAARAAEEARLGILQNRATAANAFTESQRIAKEAPVLAGIKAEALRDPVNAAAMIADSGLSPQARAEAEATLRSLTRENTQDAQNVEKFSWDREDQGFQRKQADREEANAPLAKQALEADIRARVAQADKTERENKAEGEGGAKKRAAAEEAYRKNSVYSQYDLSHPDGKKAVMDHLKSLTDPEDAAYVQNELSTLMRDGITVIDPKTNKPRTVAVPTSVALEGIMGIGESGWFGRSKGALAKDIKNRVLALGPQVLTDSDNLDAFTQDTVSRGVASLNLPPPSSSSTGSEELVPHTSTAPLDKAAEKAVAATKPPPSVSPEVTPEAAAISSVRKELQTQFQAIQKDIRESGGIDNVTPAQAAELKRVNAAMAVIDQRAAEMAAVPKATLSEQRRLADQEEARKKAMGR